MFTRTQGVKAALRAGVDASGILTLVMMGEFTTNKSIQVTVRYAQLMPFKHCAHLKLHCLANEGAVRTCRCHSREGDMQGTQECIDWDYDFFFGRSRGRC